ncbi:MAG TPA: glycosyltransferase [Thermoanaerobaculia bacterium]
MRAPTRLLWLVDSLGAGGAEALVVTFAAGLDREQHRLFVACLNGADGVNAQRLREEGVPVIDLGARNLRDVRAFRRLLALIREEHIALIHAHLTYSAIWSAIASRLTGVPAIASLHVSPEATRTLEDSVRHRIATDLRDRVLRAILNRWSRAVVMVSGALRDDYLARGLEPRKVRVVHNGIELDRFRRPRTEARALLEREFAIPPGAPVIATVAVLRPKKGIEVLLAAARDVRRAYFLIIGDGPKREEWSALATTLGVADRVRWAGFRTDVDALLAGCDLFVHPSLDDAFPTVLLEAMAAGLPIVASRVGGIPEIVTPGVTGELVPPGDPKALASAIDAVLGNEDTMRLMREAAQVNASRFSTSAWIDRLTAVYREAAA